MRANINAGTAVCMVIGDPINHSLTPRMHNAAYSAQGLPYVMVAARVSEHALSDAIRGARALNIRGLAVTMPHKVALLTSLDAVDPIAQAIGAINTVVNVDGFLTGYNTDWIGIQRPLEKRINLSGRRVAILGAGGAAQAALYACILQGASVTVFNRTLEKAQALAHPVGAHAAPLSNDADVGEYEVIINTTPVGMAHSADQSPIDTDQLSKQHTVFETIYSPRHTTLAQDARERGCEVILGVEMFVEQGAAQFELHTGVTAPKNVMIAALDTNPDTPSV
jgi:shikimate dehydrogenase